MRELPIAVSDMKDRNRERGVGQGGTCCVTQIMLRRDCHPNGESDTKIRPTKFGRSSALALPFPKKRIRYTMTWEGRLLRDIELSFLDLDLPCLSTNIDM